MKRFKISWRIYVEHIENPDEFAQMLDIMNKEGQTADEFWILIAEPSWFGYYPLAEVARKCEAYKAPAAAARARGIRVGINPWPNFGSVEQGAPGQPSLPFPPMVGMDGTESLRAPCPVSPEFLEYSRQKYTLFAQAGCDFIWVDDDCRFTHLGGPAYPCFCPRCVKGFEGGAYRDRESLVSALNQPENATLRHKWSAYGAQRLAEYCTAVRSAVDEVNPAIEMGFMSVGFSHTSFSGNYIETCMKALRAKSSRPGGGFYWDANPMSMFDKAYEVARQVAVIPADRRNDIQYEEDSYPASYLNKAASTRAIEMALSIWGGCNGVAMIHTFHTGGDTPFAYLQYECDQLRRTRSFFDRYLSFVSNLPQSGLWGAFSQWAMSGMKVDEKGWFNEFDPDYSANRFVYEWPVFGIPVTADPKGSWGALLQGRLPDVFTDDELKEMLKKPLILDGMALSCLWERGLGQLTGMKAVSVNPCGRGDNEKLAPSPYARNFAGAVRRAVYGEAYDLEPISEDVEPLAFTARPYGVPDSLCAARYKNIVVLGYNPYQFTGTPGRMTMMRNLLADLGAPISLEPTDPYDPPRVAAFARADQNRAAVLLINAQIGPSRPFDLRFRGITHAAQLHLLGQPDPAPLSLRQEGENAFARIPALAPWEMAAVYME